MVWDIFVISITFYNNDYRHSASSLNTLSILCLNPYHFRKISNFIHNHFEDFKARYACRNDGKYDFSHSALIRSVLVLKSVVTCFDKQ